MWMCLILYVESRRRGVVSALGRITPFRTLALKPRVAGTTNHSDRPAWQVSTASASVVHIKVRRLAEREKALSLPAVDKLN